MCACVKEKKKERTKKEEEKLSKRRMKRRKETEGTEKDKMHDKRENAEGQGLT